MTRLAQARNTWPLPRDEERPASHYGTDPGPEGEHEEKGGDSFVVVRSSSGMGDVARYCAHQVCREETCGFSFRVECENWKTCQMPST